MLTQNNVRLIYQTQDTLGKIRVFENSLERILTFDSNAKQSAVLKNDHSISTLRYQHVMQLVSLFDVHFNNILIMGLGAGSMVGFFQTIFPGSKVDVIEVRPKVYEVATNFFSLKVTDNLTLILGDAATELVKISDKKYDLILLDTFIDDGMPANINNPNFFSICKKKLSNTGILTVNYWSSQYIQIKKNLTALANIFNNQILKSSVESCSNLIYYLFNNPNNKQQLTFKNQKIILNLQQKYRMPYIRYIKNLLMENNLEYITKDKAL